MPFEDSEDKLENRPTRVANCLEVGMYVGSHLLDKRLGKGGMGEVWRAVDPTRGDESSPGYLALKFLPQEIQDSPRELRRALETFRAVQALQHPNICPVYFLQEFPRFGHVLAMKFIDGMNLLDYRDAYVNKHGSFPLSEVIRILTPVAAALDYAHRPGKVHSGVASVIHRDLKPENILITHDGREVQIVDFGLATQVRLSLTRVSKVETDSMGTRSYMAPEQWRAQFQDDKTDQYGLAVVAYELIADRLPFEVADPFQLRECVLNEPIPPLLDQPEHVNVALAVALSKQREDRFSSCSEFLEALQQPNDSTSRALVNRPTQVGDSVASGNFKVAVSEVAAAVRPSDRGAPPQPTGWKIMLQELLERVGKIDPEFSKTVLSFGLIAAVIGAVLGFGAAAQWFRSSTDQIVLLSNDEFLLSIELAATGIVSLVASLVGLGIWIIGWKKLKAKQQARGLLSRLFNVAANFRELLSFYGWLIGGILVGALIFYGLKFLVIAFAMPASIFVSSPVTHTTGAIAVGLSYWLVGSVCGMILHRFIEPIIEYSRDLWDKHVPS
ncbi:MAG: protein kinase [Planctomycetaceae bacterium]|nr:protein kinase [Planctomycetaceae bacterium]